MSSFNSMFNCRQFLELHRNYSCLPVKNTIFRKQRVYLSLLTYSISFSYPIFLTDYKNILKIAGGLKQLTCSPAFGSELFHAREQCAVHHSCQIMLYFFQNNVVSQFFNGMICWYYHLQWICGYVHVYKIIKQLFHACSGNSQNYCSSVLELTWELLPSAFGLSNISAISWRPVLVVEEAGVPGEKHLPWTSNW